MNEPDPAGQAEEKQPGRLKADNLFLSDDDLVEFLGDAEMERADLLG
jgi:hypothetical protein